MISEKTTSAIFFIFAIAGVFLVGYFSEQSDFYSIISGYGLMWFFYLFVLYSFGFSKKETRIPLGYFIAAGIILRFILLPTFPPLSDDYFRFIWDGYCNIDGTNPYALLPEEFNLEKHPEKYSLLYNELNSKSYYSVYPPLLQSVFSLGTWISPNNLLGSVIVMRSIMFLFEIGSIFFILKTLRLFSFPTWQVLIYTLNPLAIIEITGNLHFEGMMIFFLMASIFFISRFIIQGKQKKDFIFSAVFLGLSAGAKILPIIFLPVMIRKTGFVKSIIYGGITSLVLLLSFFMLWDFELFSNFRESIRLYYQSFEFNGGIYYVLRSIGYLFRGYNEIAFIGPGMAITAGLIIFLTSLKDHNKIPLRIPLLFLFALTTYQLLSTTVHPWYIVPLVALSALTNFRYAILWSALITLTYINYSYDPYFENKWIVALEYISVLAFMFYEIIKKPFPRSFSPEEK